eukprot:TRINITY_DN2382_c0_g1_i1.p1 TRINITY_DN2382_c0_g1~~TRINITY_DN2382_c0_g1_i1.p1  ORF type:complete len:282 (-),score=22.70 TRINITY_DN2382_c0_g1_i1:516-1361(-)
MGEKRGWRHRLFGSNPEWWTWWYVCDWACSLAFLATALLIDSFARPFTRHHLPTDPGINYPNDPDIIPDWAAVVIAALLPLVVLTLAQIWIRSHHDFHHAVLGLLTASAINQFVTVPLKMLAGRWRPDSVMRIQENPDDYDARMSFPSGHSSGCFAGLLFLTLYLLGKLRVFNNHTSGVVPKAVLACLPLALACFVAVSRTMDYHHNFDDIIAGSLIGIASAYFAYALFYHPLGHVLSHQPRMRIATPTKTPAKTEVALPKVSERDMEMGVKKPVRALEED